MLYGGVQFRQHEHIRKNYIAALLYCGARKRRRAPQLERFYTVPHVGCIIGLYLLFFRRYRHFFKWEFGDIFE